MDTSASATQVSDLKPSKIKSIMDGLRKTAFYRQIVPMETGIGWPIPLRKDGQVYVILPLFGVHPAKDRTKTALYPPFATITLEWKTQNLVEYVDLRFRTNWPKEIWEKPAGYFPASETSTMTVGEYKDKREKILNIYDEMFNLLADNRPFESGFNEEFSELLQLLMEPCLEKYYRMLAPKFFNHFLPEKSGE